MWAWSLLFIRNLLHFLFPKIIFRELINAKLVSLSHRGSLQACDFACYISWKPFCNNSFIIDLENLWEQSCYVDMPKTKEASSRFFISKFLFRNLLISYNKPISLLASKMSLAYETRKIICPHRTYSICELQSVTFVKLDHNSR